LELVVVPSYVSFQGLREVFFVESPKFEVGLFENEQLYENGKILAIRKEVLADMVYRLKENKIDVVGCFMLESTKAVLITV
jgi:hypothetical protein